MLKDFFLLDFGILNGQTGSILKTFNLLISFLFPVGLIVEMIKTYLGKSQFEARIIYLFLSLMSVTLLNTYNQPILDTTFKMADSIFYYGGYKSLDGFKSFEVKKADKKEIDKNKNGNVVEIKSFANSSGVLESTTGMVTKNISIAFTWILTLVSMTFIRQIYTSLYYVFLCLAPLIAYLAVIPSFEGSLKALWQSFAYFAILPLVFALTFCAASSVATRSATNSIVDIEALIQVLILCIMLLGSFITTYYVVTSQPIVAFAQKASLMGAMAMASPFVGMAGLASSVGGSPIRTVGNAFERLKTLGSKGLGGGLPNNPSSVSSLKNLGGSTVKDISKMKYPNYKEFSNSKNPVGTMLANSYKNGLRNPDSSLSKAFNSSSQPLPNNSFTNYGNKNSNSNAPGSKLLASSQANVSGDLSRRGISSRSRVPSDETPRLSKVKQDMGSHSAKSRKLSNVVDENYKPKKESFTMPNSNKRLTGIKNINNSKKRSDFNSRSV